MAWRVDCDENQIGGILGLHDAPTIVQAEDVSHRAVLTGKLIQLGMQGINVQFGGQMIGLFKIIDRQKSIVAISKSTSACLRWAANALCPLK